MHACLKLYEDVFRAGQFSPRRLLMMFITSVELNYLIFCYLQESGFRHSAFALGYEASINKCSIEGNLVPPGTLITFVQKGLQYLEMEANLINIDMDVDEDFFFLQPLDLIAKDIYELQKIIKEKRKSLQKVRDKDIELDREDEEEHARVRDKERHEKEKEHKMDEERTEKDKDVEKQLDEQQSSRKMVIDQEDRVQVKHEIMGY